MPAADRLVAAGRARAPLWASLLLSALGYLLLALWFPLGPNIGRVPAGDIRTFAPTLPAGLLYALIVLALFWLLLIAVRRVAAGELARLAGERRQLAALLLIAGVLALPLLFAYPINATDVFRYVIRGRVASAYGESPYIAPPSRFVGDPFMPLAGEWAGETSPYGPLWEATAAGLTAVSGADLLAGVLLFKLLALGCFLLTGRLLWALLDDNPQRAVYVALWVWNPALLLTFALNGHNDALMLLWLVAGYLVARRGRPAAGFLVMCLGALTKPIAALVLPVFFLAFWRRQPPEGRARFAVAAAGGAAALVWLTFLPWAGPGRFWQTPLELAQRLAREATSAPGFSPAVWLYFGLGQRVPIEALGGALRILFLAFALWVLWRAWRGRSAWRGAADLFFGYVAQALSFRIWYAVWPLPWLLLDAGGAAPARGAPYRLRAGFWFLVTTQLSVVLYGHARVFLLNGDQVITHLVTVPLVFGLPWLLARWPGLLPAADWRANDAD